MTTVIVLEINDSYIVKISERVPYPKFYVYCVGRDREKMWQK
jgi:hypothetical protein